MKKLFLLVVCVIAFTSCSRYNTRIMVGDVNEKTPVVEINKVTNHHLIYGLLPLKDVDVNPQEYVGNRDSYMVKVNRSFLNLFIEYLTCGIYTQTTTTFYVPLKDAENAK